MPVFPEPEAACSRPMGWAESPADYLAESTRPEAAAYRAAVNRWYANFPDEGGQLASRLRSSTEHYQARDELLVHELLHRRFSDVRYEEGGRGPDFRIYAAGAEIAAVEIASLFERQDWSDERARHARLADAINRRIKPTAGYMVSFEIEAADREPSARRFAHFLRTEIALLPPYEQLAASATAMSDLPRATFREAGVRISVRFMPLSPGSAALTDPESTLVATGPALGGAVNSGERFRQRLADKAGGRYDLGDVPFLICVGIHDLLCSTEQVLWALYGSEAILIPSGQGIRRNDGFFGVDTQYPNGRQRRISAVALLRDGPDLDHPHVTLLHNAFAARPWRVEVLPPARRFDVVEKDEQRVRLDWVDS